MTAVTDLLPQVLTYLASQAGASANLGAASPAVLVLDGPPATADQLTISQPRRLYIGAEGYPRPDEPVDAAEASQGFSFLDNARTRDEQMEIRCAAEYLDPGASPAAARGAGGLSGGGAFAILAGVEVLLRGIPSQGGPGDATMAGLVQWSEVTGPIQQHYEQRPEGCWCLVRFRVSAFVRLTT